MRVCMRVCVCVCVCTCQPCVKKGTLRMSVNNKNKVVSTSAVSCRCQILTFCLQHDAHDDHDFPYRNSKLTPAGYKILTPQIQRSRSISPPATKKQVRLWRHTLSASVTIDVTTRDKIGWEKIKWSRSGPLKVRIYPARVMDVMNVNSMMDLLNKNYFKESLHNIIADGGPDWSV